MQPKFDKDGIVLYQGDCIEVMSELAPSSVDTIITDPYGLEFMGQAWDKLDWAWHRQWASSAWRVAKPGAFLLTFGGTRTFHRLACALEEAGWLIRDCIMWLYGSGFPKSLDISKAIDKAAEAERSTVGISSGPNNSRYKGERYTQKRTTRYGVVQDQPPLTAPVTQAAKQWHGWGTALKPAWEPIIVAMKPLDGRFLDNAMKHGVAGLAIEKARVGLDDDDRLLQGGSYSGNRLGSNKASVFNSGNGKIEYSSPPGRWPANVILDDDAAAILDRQSGLIATSRIAKPCPAPQVRGHRWGTLQQKRGPRGYSDFGGASRFFYCTKASKNERGFGLPKGLTNDHPTVKPLKLMEYLCKLTTTPTGGIVLDPFAGSGSTLIAARMVGRECVGIESNAAYVKIAKERLKVVAHQNEGKGGQSSKAA